MTKELLLLLDSLTLLCVLVVLVTCITIYQRVKNKGFLFVVLAVFWMLLIRIAWLVSTFIENLKLKESLGTGVLFYWMFTVAAFITFYKDIRKVLSK